MDFVHDALADSRPLRILTVVDQWSRSSPLLEVASRMSGYGVGGALTAADTGQPAGTSYEQEGKGAQAADQVRIGVLARAWFGRRQGVELEAAAEVVGRDAAELRPGTVGAIVFSWASRPQMKASSAGSSCPGHGRGR